MFFQIFLDLVEISALCIYSIIISVVSHIASSQEAENVIDKSVEKSGPSIGPCGTPVLNILPRT